MKQAGLLSGGKADMGISPDVGIWDDTACAPPTSAAQVESAMHFSLYRD
jgi:hypothetical protein